MRYHVKSTGSSESTPNAASDREPSAGAGPTNWAEVLRRGWADETGTGIAVEAEVIAGRFSGWKATLRATDAYGEWLLEQAVILSVRLDSNRKHNWALRILAIERAETCWDEDRRHDADSR